MNGMILVTTLSPKVLVITATAKYEGESASIFADQTGNPKLVQIKNSKAGIFTHIAYTPDVVITAIAS